MEILLDYVHVDKNTGDIHLWALIHKLPIIIQTAGSELVYLLYSIITPLFILPQRITRT